MLKLEDGQEIERAERLEPVTNIVAEHLAIQLALEMAMDIGVRRLLIYNDSQTPVHQVDGIYEVKQDHLKPIVQKTWELGSHFDSVEVRWVPREFTSRADALCTSIDRIKSGRKRPGPAKAPVQDPPNPFLRSSP